MLENREAPRASVVLPTYNERDNILLLIEQILESAEHDSNSFASEIIVVDDDSPDGTGRLVQEHFGGDSRVKVLIRRGERGLATAIRHGIENASADRIVVMDTDFNHDPKAVPQLVKFLDYYDVIVGSRFTVGGGMENSVRYYLSFAYNFFLRLILRLQIQDNLSGFFSIRREKLTTLDLDRIFYGFGDYFMRLLFGCWRRRFRILAIPVFYRKRYAGSRKSRFLSMLFNYTISAMKLRLAPPP